MLSGSGERKLEDSCSSLWSSALLAVWNSWVTAAAGCPLLCLLWTRRKENQPHVCLSYLTVQTVQQALMQHLHTFLLPVLGESWALCLRRWSEQRLVYQGLSSFWHERQHALKRQVRATGVGGLLVCPPYCTTHPWSEFCCIKVLWLKSYNPCKTAFVSLLNCANEMRESSPE